MLKLPTISARYADLAPSERADVELALGRVKRLREILHKESRPTPKAVGRPKKIKSTSGKRICRLCKALHDKPDSGKRHMLNVKRRWMSQAAARYWQAVGYDVLVAASIRARHSRMVTNRLRIFDEMAPHAAAVLGEKAREVVEAVPNTGYRNFRGWVRRNYT